MQPKSQNHHPSAGKLELLIKLKGHVEGCIDFHHIFPSTDVRKTCQMKVKTMMEIPFQFLCALSSLRQPPSCRLALFEQLFYLPVAAQIADKAPNNNKNKLCTDFVAVSVHFIASCWPFFSFCILCFFIASNHFPCLPFSFSDSFEYNLISFELIKIVCGWANTCYFVDASFGICWQ